MRGVLITFEGVEGSGKSTQAERLHKWLSEQGVACILSREPGGTAIGEQVRDILLDPDNRAMDGLTELFLYLASRNQHVREKVRPALEKGMVVILDRYIDSSSAYQGFGRGLGARPVSRLNKLAIAGLRPHLTVLVDVPVKVGQDRKEATSLDRLERERVEFHESVREGYLRIARRARGRFRVLDGRRPAEELERAVQTLVKQLLSRKGILKCKSSA
jgi:dTMP kinase